MFENQDQAVIPVVNDADNEVVESNSVEADDSTASGKTTAKTTASKRQKKDANNKQAESKNDGTNELSETTTGAKKEGLKNALIYLGPNVPGGVLNTGSVYKSGIPKHLDDLIKNIPEISKMFVDVSKAGKAKVDISQQGTELFRLYQQLDYALKKKPKERSVE